MTSPDTIFAHSSGSAPAAIAVVRVSGPAAHSAAERLAGALPPPRTASLRRLSGADGTTIDRALILRFDAPASSTGEDLVEFHCHGGRAVVTALLAELGSIEGLREALPGEFTRRAFEHGRIDLTEAEGLADLLEAETEEQRRAALAIASGAIRRQVENWREQVVSLAAQAEAAIDYVGDEDETSVDVFRLSQDARLLAGEIDGWLDKPRAEPLLRGLRVVLAGPPNVGKSSLLNALAGIDKAIVSPEAGTTRDVIEVPMALGGIWLILIDTAGLRQEGAGEVEQIGVERASQQVQAADLVLWLGSPSEAPSSEQVILVHSRTDVPGREHVPPGSIGVSALTGEGIPALVQEIISSARGLLPTGGDIPLNRRQAAALAQAAAALRSASGDLVLLAEDLRAARNAFDQVTGRAGVEDLLDALFGRFCLGK